MKRLLIVPAMLLAFAAVAQSQTPFLDITDGAFSSRHTNITIKVHQFGPTPGWTNVHLSSQGLVSGQVNASAYSWMADGPGAYQNQWYCVDLNSFQGGSVWDFYHTATLTEPFGSPAGNYGTIEGLRRAAWLVNTYHDEANTATLRAALQLAVWEAVYDGGDPTATTLDITAGDFRTEGFNNSTVTNKAASWYAESFGKSGHGIYGVDGQNVLGRSEIPEPGTLILLGLGLTVAGVGVIRRRRKA